jgi:hypothetical protein
MLSQALNVRGRDEEGFLPGDDFLNTIGQGFPVFLGQLQLSQVEYFPVARTPGHPYRFL